MNTVQGDGLFSPKKQQITQLVFLPQRTDVLILPLQVLNAVSNTSRRSKHRPIFMSSGANGIHTHAVLRGIYKRQPTPWKPPTMLISVAASTVLKSQLLTLIVNVAPWGAMGSVNRCDQWSIKHLTAGRWEEHWAHVLLLRLHVHAEAQFFSSLILYSSLFNWAD